MARNVLIIITIVLVVSLAAVSTYTFQLVHAQQQEVESIKHDMVEEMDLIHSNATIELAYDHSIAKTNNLKNDRLIQNAIDLTSSKGGGDVYVPAGTYYIDNTIVIKPSVTLILSSAARLIPNKDVNVVELKRNSAFKGGLIYTYPFARYTKSAIYLNGAEKFSGASRAAVISDVKLLGRPDQGNGIYFYAAKGRDNISWVQVTNVNISGYNKAIHFKTEPVKDPDVVWINGNNFSQILIQKSTYGIYLDGHRLLPYEISGNTFTNVQIQTSRTMKTAIYVKGTKNYIQAMIWDYHLGTEAVRLDEDSLRNQIYSNVKADDDAFKDDGQNNLIVSAE